MGIVDKNIRTGSFLALPVALTIVTGNSYANMDHLDLEKANYYPQHMVGKTYTDYGLSIDSKLKLTEPEALSFEEFISAAFNQIKNAGILTVDEEKDIEVDRFFTKIYNEKQSPKTRKLYVRK